MPLAFGLCLLAGAAPVSSPGGGPAPAEILTAARVARFPPPGSRVPTGFQFTHDGRILYYLSLEGPGPDRSLVREEVAGGRREVVASAGTAAGSEFSREEVLRRERQRIQDRGITQFVLAAKADRVVYALAGDLYLARPGAAPVRLTRTEASEIDPQLSPDGSLLAFVRGGDLFVMDVATRRETRLTTGARDGLTHGVAEYIAQEEMDRPHGYWWAPDGTVLAYTEADSTGIPVYPIVHQGRDVPDIEPHRYPFAGGPNARVRLGLVPASGGATTWLDLGGTVEAGDGYLARVAFGPDGTLYAQTESRDQKVLRLVAYDPPERRPRRLLEERSKTWIDLARDFRPLADGRFLWSSERTGWRHLELRARDGSLVRALTSGAWPVDRLEGVDEARGVAFFTAARESPLEKNLYRVGLDGGPVARVTTEDGFHAIAMARTGTVFVDQHDSLKDPPRVLLRGPEGDVLRVLCANDDPEVRALALHPPELVTIPGPDGTTLYGAVYAPSRARPGTRHPAIVRVYGGPTVQTVKDSWELTQDLRAQFLARHGYVVFRLDNRGTPRRGRAFEDAIDRHLGSVEVADQIAGARWLAGRPDVDPGRIGVYGWSYGGYMAALLILEAPDLFRAAVVGAPVTDWAGYDTHYTERYMGTPQDNPEGYAASSVLRRAADLRGDVLLIHGMVDENVHFRHTARLLGALNGAQRRYRLLVFPEERHLPRGERDREYLEERILDHFDRALGAGPEARSGAPK